MWSFKVLGKKTPPPTPNHHHHHPPQYIYIWRGGKAIDFLITVAEQAGERRVRCAISVMEVRLPVSLAVWFLFAQLYSSMSVYSLRTLMNRWKKKIAINQMEPYKISLCFEIYNDQWLQKLSSHVPVVPCTTWLLLGLTVTQINFSSSSFSHVWWLHEQQIQEPSAASLRATATPAAQYVS